MSAAISDQHMAHHFADLNLDMSLVLKDAAKKQTATGAAEAGSIPKASESQHLSMGMASLLGADDTGGDIFYRPASSTPVTADISYAAMVTQTLPSKDPPTAKSPSNTGKPRSKSRSSKPTTEEIEAERQRQSEKAKARTTMKPAAKISHTAPHQSAQDDLSAITAEDTRPSAVATISVGTRSIDPSSITADTAAILQAQHAEMQAKLDAQATQFAQFMQSIQQANPPNSITTPNSDSMSATAHNSGGGPAL
jgi:flagellar biosynthesis GTPase FlhF